MTPGTRTKSTRARKSKLPMIGEPDMIRTESSLSLLDQRMRDGAAAAQMPEAEGVVAVDQYPGIPHAGFSAALRLSLVPIFRGGTMPWAPGGRIEKIRGDPGRG